MSDHGVVRELLPLFALGALEGSAECEQVCAHLASGCASCAEELAAFARTAGALPVALPAVAPRPGVRERLDAKLRTVSQVKTEPQAKVVSFPAPKKDDRGFPRWSFAAAAGLAGVGLVFGAATYRDLSEERGKRWEAERRVSEQLVELDALQKERDATNATLAKLADPDVKVFELGPLGAGETGRGRIVWDTKNRTWTLVAKDLKPLPADKVYELWFIAGNSKIPAGRFRPDVNGVIRHSIAVPAGLDKIDLGAITREPTNDPDPQQPSNELVIGGKTA